MIVMRQSRASAPRGSKVDLGRSAGMCSHGILLAATIGLSIASSSAQAAWPERPVMMVVPYAAGGSAEVLARAIAPEMSAALGQAVQIELKPGAGGNIGGSYVARTAPSDGYTILLGSVSLATGPSLSTLNFDPLRDLKPIGGVGAVPNLLVVSSQSPYRSLADLLGAARSRPGTISYGSSGLGTGSHLAGELLAALSGSDITHVPYRGSGAVYPDLVSQNTTFLLDGMTSAVAQVRSGAVRAIGISSPARSAVLPDVPTISEQGVEGYEFSLWLGFFARSGTPQETLTRLEEAHRKALHSVSVQERLAQAAAQPIPEDTAGFTRYFSDSAALWADLVARGKVRKLD